MPLRDEAAGVRVWPPSPEGTGHRSVPLEQGKGMGERKRDPDEVVEARRVELAGHLVLQVLRA